MSLEYISTESRERAGCWFTGSPLQEPVIYGGLLATRQEVYEDLAEKRGPNGERIGHLMLDSLAWMCRPARRDEVKQMNALGLTLKSIRESEAA